MKRRTLIMSACLLAVFAAAGCQRERQPEPATSARGGTLVVYDWDGDLPLSLLEKFGRERGVKVERVLYESQEEAIANLRAGKAHDVLVLESWRLAPLLRENLLAEVDYRNVPNRRNLSPAFRDLAADPGNRHNVPFSFGTTGLVVREDVAGPRVAHWADLWDRRFRGRAGVWVGVPRELLAITLKSMGRSANSEDPAQIEAAVQRFLQLAPHLAALEDFDPADSSGALLSGRITLAHGYAGDVEAARKKNGRLSYVLPEEGALLWNDSFVLPAANPNRRIAEDFLDFMLRADVAASYVVETGYAVPNDAALALLPPEVRGNTALFPGMDDLRRAESILSPSPERAALVENAMARIAAVVPRAARRGKVEAARP